MNRKKVIALGAILGVAASCVALAVPANADPVSNTYVLAGSDTLQDAANALINGTNVTGTTVRVSSTSGTLGSYDAFGSASIQVKPSGPYFARPAGSGDGIKALEASIDGTTSYTVANNATPGVTIGGQVDIARSSAAPATPNASGPLAFIPFARDAVTYAYKGGSAALASIPTTDLNKLYACDAATLTAYGNPTPVLPQAASGTRKFFLSAIGAPTLGGCVVNGTRTATGVTVQENDGTQINDNEIIPFSAASYYAQQSGAAQNRLSTAVLGTPLGSVTPLVSGAPNPAYYSSSVWGRDTYLVVEYARINPNDTTGKYDSVFGALFVPTAVKSLINFSSGNGTSGGVKAKFGFLPTGNTTIIRASLQ